MELTTPTRERLVDAAMLLFAEHGYRGTSVGAIEAAAGLSPRAGGFYRHFGSKREILDLVIARLIGAVVAEVTAGQERAFASPRDELEAVGEDTLALLRQQSPVVRLVMRDGDREPDIAAAVRAGLVDPGYQFMTMVFAKLAPDRDETVVRMAALQAAATLAAYVNEEGLFGHAMGGVTDAELIASWTAVWSGVLGIAD